MLKFVRVLVLTIERSYYVHGTNAIICEMIPLETKQYGGKLLPQSDFRGGSVSRGNVMQALQVEGVQRREGNGIVLEEALDLPFDRLLMMIIIH